MPPMFPQWKIEVRVVFEISLKGSVGKAGQSTYVKGISLSRAYCSAKESFSTIRDSCLQLLNASLSISTTEPGIRTLVRLLQFAKVYFFNSVTDDGISISFRLLQSWKAYGSIDATLSGISTLVRLLHPEKTDTSISVTLSGILIPVRPVQSEKAK